MEKSPEAFRTISEVAEHLETPAHVLRFWESRFPQIRPVKRAGGRRYYRPADVALLTGIKRLLHDEGMTIRGVQKILREQGVRFVSGMSDDTNEADDDAALEAALASSSGPSNAEPALPAAEAEAAQVIALETALSATPAKNDANDSSETEGDDASVDDAHDSEELGEAETGEARLPVLPTPFSPKDRKPEQPSLPPRKPSADDGISDLFSRMVASTAAAEEDTPGGETSDDDVEIIDFGSSKASHKPVTADVPPEEAIPPSLAGSSLQENEAKENEASESAEEEAPMAVWAEDASLDAGPDDSVAALPTPGPSLRVTRIGTASNGSSATSSPPKAKGLDEQSEEGITETPIASRLRATDPNQLTHSERGTITVIRARARSLRDRLIAPPRLGH